MSTWVKICGIKTVADAAWVAEAGADAIGLNFVDDSKRRISVEGARAIVDALRAQGQEVSFVGVFANQKSAYVIDVARQVGLDAVQLHGHESPAELESYLERGMRAFKAVRVADAHDVELARAFGGELLLLDAKVGDELGGTGQSFDWGLIGDLVAQRKVILAGGLHPLNVAGAVASVRPFGVDTASGVEASPGVKDRELVRDFLVRTKAIRAPD